MSHSPSPVRILVVDDENLIASTLTMILRQQGYDASGFTQPLDALAAALSHTPDLLISDIAMPQMSGIELAIQLTDRCPQCKVVLLSGQATTVDLTAKAADRAFQFLVKPVHPAIVLRKIRDMVDGSH